MKTDRIKWIDKEVLETAPQGGSIEDIEFFHLGECASNEKLEQEYAKRNLIPANIDVLMEYNKEHRDKLDEMDFVGTQWKDAEGNWCYASFRCWVDDREVSVSRYGHDWDDDWWFAGLRKSSAINPSTLSDPLSLENRVTELERKMESLINGFRNIK